MGDFTRVIIGTGALKIDNVSAGFLKGDVSFTFGVDTKIFESGVPLREQGRIPIRQRAELSASMAEITAENASRLLGGMSLQTIGSVKRLNLGASSVLTPAKVEFTYTHPVTAKTIVIVLWKAIAEGILDMKFQEEDFTLLNARFTAQDNSTAHPTNPLGYIDFLQ